MFHTLREDFDGSFVIVWKILKSFNFEDNIKEKILSNLRAKGFNDVTVDISTMPITLRGTVPKGKMAEAIQAAAIQAIDKQAA